MASSRTRARILAFSVSALAIAGAARAQNEDTSSSVQTKRTSVGEVVVTAAHYVPQGEQTATKTNIPLIQTPQSISVITRDQIDLLDFVDAQQAVRYTAGVFGENYGPDLRYDFINVRGFTPKQYIDGLAAPAT
ncbi:MAG TPA: TonB-dependent receptor plug domain-containing protein, partial [Caulobacteraceae bacterium]|nr:TonB-dependent receptor plug domain-containing protein [Caulobacteraceae bacterium]